MSFIKELKRRNVFKVAIAYAVIAWLLIEISSTTFPILQLPDWSVTLVTALVLLGFPLALVFAWAFEVTPDGIKFEKDVDRAESVTHQTGQKLHKVIIALLAIALAYMVADRFIFDQQLVVDMAAIDQKPNSIAVLPFVDMSPEQSYGYFSDGLSEELLNLLAKTPNLSVAARTSSFAFKGKNEDIKIIAETLNVETVLEGSVRHDGNQIRVTTQLINAADGYHLWSETYDRELTSVFALQDEIAQEIISALQVELGAGSTISRGRPTENMEAYGLYLQAMERMRVGGTGFPDAIKLAREAIELDPNFAEAYEISAVAAWSDAGIGVTTAEALAMAKSDAEKALALKPDLLWAQTILLGSDPPTYDRLAELEAQERLINAQPSNSKAKTGLIYNLLFLGYLSEARAAAERLIELDPLYPAGHGYLGSILYAQRDFASAEREWEFARELGFTSFAYYQGLAAFIEGDDERALELMLMDLRNMGRDPGNLPQVFSKAREERTTAEQLRKMLDADPVWHESSQYWFVFAAFGYTDELFTILEEIGAHGKAQNDAEYPLSDLSSLLPDGYLADPRFIEIAEAYGMADIWRRRGPPDYCTPAGDSWVCK